MDCPGSQGEKCKINHNGIDDELENDIIDNKHNTITNVDEIEKLKSEIKRLNKVIENQNIPKPEVKPVKPQPKKEVISDLDADLLELQKPYEPEIINETDKSYQIVFKKKLDDIIIDSDSDTEDEDNDISHLF